MKKVFKGGYPWTPDLPWDADTHPWLTAYCGAFALAMKLRFPEVGFALEYVKNPGLDPVADHALVHDGQRFFDARGFLVHYTPIDDDDLYTLTYLEEGDLQRSGLLLPYPGLRDLTTEEAVELALKRLEAFENLDDFYCYE